MTFFPENVDWSKLAKPDFWLEGIAGQNTVPSAPLSEIGFRNFILALVGTFVIAGIAIRLFKIFLTKQHPLQNRLSTWTANLIWIGVLGTMWWLFNQWGPLLFIGSRFWILVGFIWFLILLYFILKYFITEYPLEIAYYRRTYLQNKTDEKIDKDSPKLGKKSKEALK